MNVATHAESPNASQHLTECTQCEGQGTVDVLRCGHYGCACPCATKEEVCEECGGTGFIVDLSREGEEL